jgi:hypothetical protein
MTIRLSGFCRTSRTLPGVLPFPFRSGWDHEFESAFLQRAVCLSSELRKLSAKGAAFAAVCVWSGT